jgi:hypothetical protein
MSTVGSASSRNRLVAAAGIVGVLVAIVFTTVLLPDRTLAQAGEPDQVEPGPVRTSPAPPPPPAIQLNPPAATPEPGEFEASAGPPAGGSDLEIVRFQPEVQLELDLPPVSSQIIDNLAPAGKDDIEKPPTGQSAGPQEAYTPLGYQQLLATQDWNLLLYEDFEWIFPGAWQLFDASDDGFERSWGDTYRNAQFGSWSAWPAALGADAVDPVEGYPNDLDSWMVQGPFDLSNMADLLVSFGLWYHTEFAYDWVYFCVSTEWPTFSCDYWSGDSEGWTDHAYWLTAYTGEPEVWFAWRFYSDFSIGGDEGYAGPYVDEIYVLGYEETTPVVEGQLIHNGSFETGDLTDWSTDSWASVSVLGDQRAHFPSLRPDTDRGSASDHASPLEGGVGILEVGVTADTSIDGSYSAFLSRSGGFGGDFLYQAFDVPPGVTDIALNFWSRIETPETIVDTDLFCVGLWSPEFPDFNESNLLVDLGCLDAVDATGLWQETVYTLDSEDVTSVAGQSVALAFELYNSGDAGSGTKVLIDAVQVQALGGSGGGYLDINEPNDDPASATAIVCDQTITGTIGDAVGSYGDVDWFVLGNVLEGQLDIDIDARAKTPPSELDSVVYLYSSTLDLVDWNDDYGIGFDSYLTHTNETANAMFYIRVESYSGYGSSDSFYDLKVQCASGAGGPPPAGGEPTPPDDTWTVMLYLNAEDPGFESILTDYRRDIEKFIGSNGAFFDVVILYDGPGNSDTTRYLVQPNGEYTANQNRWNLGELNMGDRDTLADFVNWVMERYPAENYYLAIDDHGDGVYGISVDRTSDNDLLTPDEVYAALKTSTGNGDPNRRIDILDYEACLMGLAENAYDLREWVDYVVFSEQISWGIDTYPVYFHDLAANDTPLEVGQRIVDRYYAEALAVNDGRGYPHTISLIDTSKMEAVRDAVNSFGDVISATDTQAQKDKINDARDDSQAFAADMDATNSWRAEYIDLWDLADNASDLARSQADAVKSAVDAAVVHERHASGGASGYTWNHSGAHGLSIYYPPTSSSSAFDSYVAESIYQMSRDGTWDEFLKWAVPSGTRRGMSASRSEIKLSDRGDAFAFKYVYLPAVLK